MIAGLTELLFSDRISINKPLFTMNQESLNTTPVVPITLDKATSLLLSHAFSGAIGPTAGKGVIYSLMAQDAQIFTFSVALEGDDDPSKPIDRYRVVVDRSSGGIRAAELIVLTECQLAEAVLNATGHHLATFSRFTDGLLSISYKVSVQENTDFVYVVQLRHHGDVASMNTLMQHVSPILPVPPVYPISKEREKQKETGMGLQITQFVPGIMGNDAYHRMSHTQRLVLIERLAVAFDALWSLSLPTEPLIGELKAIHDKDGGVVLTVGPDRYNSLGGPFSSITDYLRAYIRTRLQQLTKKDGIDEYKTQYLPLLTAFVDAGIHSIPAVVEEVPIVVLHQDMGLHNIILSSDDPTTVKAIIDWEFCASAPYPSIHPVIERFFRMKAMNGFGTEYPHAEELRRTFWDAIPKWKELNQSEAVKTFMEWFRFGMFMVPEWRPDDLGEGEKKEYWAENVRVVEEILKKYRP